MDLDNYQSNLETHFKHLMCYRSKKAPDRPVFGLEHGLDESALADLCSGIRKEIQQRQPSWNHRLPWMVYAAELGYIYSGDEYWQTFEAETPGWEIYGDRHWIRRCFLDFKKNYDGAQPTGPWARHFSIICWPITHAILPKDLQRQLAQILYELRFSLSSQVLESPMRLGELIAARSWKASRRFQQLAEEPLFLGQIATALLLQDSDSTSAIIDIRTLQRISADVNRERGARTWLRGARQSAQRRIQFNKLHGHSTGEKETGKESDNISAAGISGQPSIEPRLIMRPLSSRKWELLLELPDLSHLSAASLSLNEALNSTGFFVAGSSGRRSPGRRLMYGGQRVALKSWPGSSESLIRLEQSIPDIDRLLETECLLRPASIRLFKIARDGLAYELKTCNVRPRQRYVLLAEDDLQLPAGPCFGTAMIECKGVNATELLIKDTIPPDLAKTLSEIGIGQTTSISVWPAGVTPSRWDGEGNAEWLSTERVRLGIQSEHHVKSFEVDLGFELVEIPPSELGKPVFVELPELDPGSYLVVIRGKHDDADQIESATLQINVRDPRLPSLGYSDDSPLLVVLDPSLPTLEQLWEGQIECSIYGPPSRNVCIGLEFFHKGSTKPIFSKDGPFMPLAVSSRQWRDYCNKHFKSDRSTQNAFDDAQSCIVNVNARELGVFSFTIEREFTPVRTVVRRVQNDFYLRVSDDSGSEQEPMLTKYDFDDADIGRLQELTDYLKIDGKRTSPGLYVAQCGDYYSSVIIPPAVRTFQDLNVECSVSKRSRSVGEVKVLLEKAHHWGSGRVTGSILSFYMKRQVLDRFFGEILALIAGQKWSEGEHSLEQAPSVSPLACMTPFIKKQREVELSEHIHRNSDSLSMRSPRERVQFMASAVNSFLQDTMPKPAIPGHAIDSEEAFTWLCELSLRIASANWNVYTWAGTMLVGGINYLLEAPSLARAARFIVLCLGHIEEPEEVRSFVYQGWTWD